MKPSESSAADPSIASTNPSGPPRRHWLARLGPGLITGASDDDPSGIGTYSQAGAQYGYSLLWTMLFCLPLMIAAQEISARIGRITGRGLAGNIRKYYSKWILYPAIFLLVVANTFNLGADIGAMGDAVALLIGGPALLYAALFTALCIILQIFASYPRCSAILKWLTLALFSYVATAFFVHVPWKTALLATVRPSLHLGGDYWAMFIAILGTTISPYLFFWQASQETEEIKSSPEQEALKHAPAQARTQFSRIRLDTIIGMAFSNLVAFFIILSAAVTLHAHGSTDIETSAQAADALRPVAGKFAFILFTLGIVGTGLLAVPVLAGSAASAVGEAMQWPTGLDRKPMEARGFYSVLSVATVIGLALNFPAIQHYSHLSPIKALFWSAVINGVVAAPILAIMMLMCHNKRVMGPYTRISRSLRTIGWLTTAVMAAAAVGLFATWKK
ncbi:MAG TPA: divalent metal cation transporter [Tepidisphaeraceae bacterium]|jgi:NRAMP (natural resistance-associated macrophage protein)-like metal ion transporter|nr:divalent metal cation transporter [Tepidisphaeraceae bacterium]